jgi:hypothetical protein
MQKVILIFGPSGSGKSTVGEKLAKNQNFLHYEVDRSDGVDGIDFYDIRIQWDQFLIKSQPKPLFEIGVQRAREAGKNGIVFSFPSLIPDAELIKQAEQEGLHSVILYGTAEECLMAFRKREQETGRNLPIEHWLANNARSFIIMGFREFAEFRVSTFVEGNRKKLSLIIHEILIRME